MSIGNLNTLDSCTFLLMIILLTYGFILLFRTFILDYFSKSFVAQTFFGRQLILACQRIKLPLTNLALLIWELFNCKFFLTITAYLNTLFLFFNKYIFTPMSINYSTRNWANFIRKDNNYNSKYTTKKLNKIILNTKFDFKK